MAESWIDKLPELQAEWEAGSFAALQRAFIWCAGNGHPLPPWLTAAVLDELAYSKAHRPRGDGTKANSELRERQERKHRLRFILLEQCLAFQQMEIDLGRRVAPLNKTEAARSVQQALGSKHPAWGMPTEIIKSHKKMKTG